MWRGIDAALSKVPRKIPFFLRLKQNELFLEFFVIYIFFFSSRFQLSLRVAALYSKASYRVKTTDSLDYRDLVCVFSNLIQ